MKNYIISGIFSHRLSSHDMSHHFSILTLPITQKQTKKKRKNKQRIENFKNLFLSGPVSFTMEEKRKDSSFTLMIMFSLGLQ